MQKLNRLLTWPLALLILLTGIALAAPDIPQPDTDVAGWLKALYAAATSKEWAVVFGLAMVGVTYPLRRWGGMVLPWFKTPFGGLALGFLTNLGATLGLALAAHTELTLGLVATSLAGAATAAGVWEWLKTHVPGVQGAADKAIEPAPAMAGGM